MKAESHSQQHKRRMYERALCQSCDAPLLDEEIAADAKRCGVCRALQAQRKAKKRSTRAPQEIAEHYGRRIAKEQAKRRLAGLPEAGRAARDVRHARQKAR